MSLDLIQNARRPEDIFGTLTGTDVEKLGMIAIRYRALSKEVHPDHGGSDAVFALLTQWRDKANAAITKGTYGQTKVALVTFSTKHANYELYEAIGNEGVATVYDGFAVGSHEVLVNIARKPIDNILMQNEAKVLAKLKTEAETKAKGYIHHLPDFHETFIYEEGGYHLQANAFGKPLDFCTLQQALEAYPNGVHGKDMAWIFRRLLDTLGFAHANDIVHGAVLPSNILIGIGDNHEVVLKNWQASVHDNHGHVPLLDKTFKDYYPAEVAGRQTPSAATDIYMAAKCMLRLMQLGNPRLTGFLMSCVFANQKARPQDAWKLRREFTEVIDTMWRDREYRPFHLPKGK